MAGFRYSEGLSLFGAPGSLALDKVLQVTCYLTLERGTGGAGLTYRFLNRKRWRWGGMGGKIGQTQDHLTTLLTRSNFRPFGPSNRGMEAPSQSAMMHPPELTIIVAATNRSMGIGLGGTLPWALKKDMAYFARITKRTPQPLLPGARNAVIMGRKTWGSIPDKFRPLKDRFNVVVSRTMREARDGRELLVTSSLQSASDEATLGKVFVIGGAEIYRQALELSNCNRILLTRILDDFETDVSFPVVLDPTIPGPWKMKSREELDEFVGENTPEGVQVENGIRYVFEMWERTLNQGTQSLTD